MYDTITTFWNTLNDDRGYGRVHRILFRGHLGLLCVLLLIAGANVAFRQFTLPLHTVADTDLYVQTAGYLAGETWGVVSGHRLLKPLAPVSMTLLAPLLEGNYYFALLVIAAIFYYLLVPVIYFFAYRFLHDRMQAFVSALLYICSYPLLMYGLDYYTETGALFFHLLGLLWAAYYFREPRLRYVVYSALASTAGVLWKEYAALSGVALSILILLAHIPWKTKLAHLFTAAVIALPILISWQVYVYEVYHYTYLEWYVVGVSEPAESSQYSLYFMAKSSFALLLLAWPLVLGGILKWRTFAREDRIPLLVAFITSLGFLAWGYVSSRLYFVSVPVLVTLAGRGFSWCTTRTFKLFAVGIALASAYAWLILVNMPAVRAWVLSFN